MIAVFCIHSQVLRKTKDEIFICMHHKFLVCSQNCMEQLGSQWTDFHEIWYLSVFRKSVRKNLNFIKIWQEQRIFHMKTCLHLWFLALFFLKSEMFQTNVVEKIKTHILCSIIFSIILCRLWDNVEKYYGVVEATDDNVAHTLCMLYT